MRLIRWRAAAAAPLVLMAMAAPAVAAEGGCPWTVQPYVSEAVLRDGRPTWDILYDGLERRRFYAFTVRSDALAERIRAGGPLPELGDGGLPLEAVPTPFDSNVYRLDPASVGPPTVFLVASAEPVPDLEGIGASFEPARPRAVSRFVPKFRGGSDRSGPLPQRASGPAPATALEAGSDGDLVVCSVELAAR